MFVMQIFRRKNILAVLSTLKHTVSTANGLGQSSTSCGYFFVRSKQQQRIWWAVDIQVMGMLDVAVPFTEQTYLISQFDELHKNGLISKMIKNQLHHRQGFHSRSYTSLESVDNGAGKCEVRLTWTTIAPFYEVKYLFRNNRIFTAWWRVFIASYGENKPFLTVPSVLGPQPLSLTPPRVLTSRHTFFCVRRLHLEWSSLFLFFWPTLNHLCSHFVLVH